MDFADIQGWIQAFSYPAVLLLLVAAGLGAPVSEDVVLIAAGFVTQHGGGSLPWMILTGYVGVLAGDSLLWRFGRKLGPRATRARWVRRVLTPARVAWAERHFDRHGALTVFLVRFCIGFRAVTFLTAGSCGLPYRRFLLADALAAALYVPALTWLGWRFGAAVLKDVKSALAWVLAGVIALVLAAVTVSFVRRRRGRVVQRASQEPV